MFRLHAGKVNEALDDLLACHRLGRLASRGPTIIDTLVGIAIDGIACRSDAAAAIYARLNSKEAVKTIADLRALSPWSSVAEKVGSSQRFAAIDAIQYMAREDAEERGSSGGDSGPLSAVREIVGDSGLAAIDWDTALRVVNFWEDRFVGAIDKPTRAEQVAALRAVSEEVDRATVRRSRWEIFAEFFSGRSPRAVIAEQIGLITAALECPAFDAALHAEDRGKAQFQLTVVALALAAYRADRGSYPEKLADFCPKYLSEVPCDPCGDGPPKYRRIGKEYEIYSVGPNGKDDGGHGYGNPDDKEATSDQDDIVVRSCVR
jgi:hypothetical protein